MASRRPEVIKVCPRCQEAVADKDDGGKNFHRHLAACCISEEGRDRLRRLVEQSLAQERKASA